MTAVKSFPRKTILIVTTTIIVMGGAAMAVSATTTTNPVKLCASKVGVVSLAKAGVCTKGDTAFDVASNTDVQALATRLDAAESAAAAQAGQITNLQASVDSLQPGSLTQSAAVGSNPGTNWVDNVSGNRLQPGSTVTMHFVDSSITNDVGTVLSEGNFFGSTNFGCETGNVFYTAIDVHGYSITSNTVESGPGCP